MVSSSLLVGRSSSLLSIDVVVHIFCVPKWARRCHACVVTVMVPLWWKRVDFLHVLGYWCNVRCGVVQVLWAVSPIGRPARACCRQPAVSFGVCHQPQCDRRIRRRSAAHAVLCKALVRDLHVRERRPTVRRHVVFDVAVHRVRGRSAAGWTHIAQQLTHTAVPLQLLHAGDFTLSL